MCISSAVVSATDDSLMPDRCGTAAKDEGLLAVKAAGEFLAIYEFASTVRPWLLGLTGKTLWLSEI
jgi:hypothetical protein